jgi:hypothetical protein
MVGSITELREQARLLEAELARLVALSDSLDTRAGIAIGFGGVLTGLLVQVKHVSDMLHAAITVAFVATIIGALAAFPSRLKSPDVKVITSFYDRLPEHQAVTFVCGARLTAIEYNTDITNIKRWLLTLAVVVLMAAIVLSALAVSDW